jgi:chromate reductase, NAD(P)H dehydrogenase (quinone)
MHKKKIIALSGSLRQDSVNFGLLKTFAVLCQGWANFDFSIQPGELPYFNSALDHGSPPVSVAAFRNLIASADGVIVCSPEYVFSMPGALKNALEWMVSTVIFTDKPTAIITASSVGEKAHESLQLVLKTIGARFTGDTTMLISSVKTKVDITGHFTDDTTALKARQLSIAFEQLCTG